LQVLAQVFTFTVDNIKEFSS